MKCEDFVAVDEVYQPTHVYLVAGVDHPGLRETDTMVVDTAKPVAVIVGECKKTPKASFKTKVRELYKRSGQIFLFASLKAGQAVARGHDLSLSDAIALTEEQHETEKLYVRRSGHTRGWRL
jgi:hypothetical protein